MLVVGEHSSEDDYHCKHDTEIEVRCVTLVLLDAIGDEAQNGSCPKQVVEEASKAQQELHVPRETLLLCEGVGAQGPELVRCLFFGQTEVTGVGRVLLDLGLKILGKLFGIDEMLGLNKLN